MVTETKRKVGVGEGNGEQKIARRCQGWDDKRCRKGRGETRMYVHASRVESERAHYGLKGVEQNAGVGCGKGREQVETADE